MCNVCVYVCVPRTTKKAWVCVGLASEHVSVCAHHRDQAAQLHSLHSAGFGD